MTHTLISALLFPSPRLLRILSTVLGLLMSGALAHGQSLLERPASATPSSAPVPSSANPAAGTGPGGAPAAIAGDQTVPSNPAADALAGYSLMVVNPPAPRKYAKHDIIQIIVNQSSIQRFNQTSDDKKDYNFEATLAQFPSLQALFENGTLENGIGSSKPSIGVGANNKYKGEGKYKRDDTVQTKVSATVIDVKPNGNLVLEARESVKTDREVSTLVLSGVCRAEDITRSNTVQSAQVADLNIRIEHEGDVKNTAERGLIPRVLEFIFNF